MPFPNVPIEFETFFEPTRIWLFGKEFKSIKYVPDSMIKPPKKDADGKIYSPSGEDADGEFGDYNDVTGMQLPMPPKRLERMLRRGLKIKTDGTLEPDQEEEDKEKQVDRRLFARIYSFSYEGHYYRLPRPLLFLVRGPGADVGAERDPVVPKPGGGGDEDNMPDAGFKPRGPRAQTGPTSAKWTGVEARDWQFSRDIRVWAVDRKDLAICLDVEVGNYQEVLLDPMIALDRRDEDRATRSRGDLYGRGAGSFRGDMIGPHQNKL